MNSSLQSLAVAARTKPALANPTKRPTAKISARTVASLGTDKFASRIFINSKRGLNLALTLVPINVWKRASLQPTRLTLRDKMRAVNRLAHVAEFVCLR